MATPARVEPMNTTSQHAKVKAALRFADQTFVSGGVVAGKMEVECKADKGLAMSIIMVELLAFEELLSRDHSAAQTFLHSQRVFQGPGLPPSNAVHPCPAPSDPVLPKDYYPARRGTTAFLFRIHIPESSPPSINFGAGVARIRYEVRAMIGVLWKGEKQLVISKSEVNVIERYDPRSLLTRPESVVVSENGKIWMKGEIVGEGVFAGEPACVALTVKNHSPKKNTGLTVTMIRQLILPDVPADHPLQVQDSLASVPFRGPEYIINPGVEGVAHLIFNVPDGARTVKAEPRCGGEDERRISPNLFSIRCIVSVTMSMGFGSKDVQLDLPVTVYHPSLLPAATDLARVNTPPYSYSPLGDVYSPSVSPIPYMNLSPSPHHYPLPVTPPPVLPFVDNGRVWLPSPSPAPFQHPYYPPYQPMQLLPPPQAPYISPMRSSSAEPAPSTPYYSGPPGFPPSSVQLSLPPQVGFAADQVLREEGKGERASRITRHLRLSSRARSTSPQSHRYAIANVDNTPPHNVDNTPQQAAAYHQESPLFTPLSRSPSAQPSVDNANLSPSMGNVVSPRPMHSPKHTVTVDPFTYATFNKSERVEALERIAADTVKSNADMSRSVPDLLLELDKTLPKPPVPSGKPARPEERPRVEALFAPPVDDEYAPRTPTLAAFSSPKASRAALGHLGGLDALEAKLLAEVGTRKMSEERRLHVRAIMPINIPRPGAVPDPAVDSAISSLSLPGIAADEGTLRFEQESHDGAVSERGGAARGSREVIEEDTRSVPNQLRDLASPKERARKKSTPKPRADDVKEKEQLRLRKAARGRVAAWLGSIDPEAPPITASPPPDSPFAAKIEVAKDSGEPAEQPEVAPATSSEPVVNEDRQSTIKGTAIAANLLVDEPNPRSSGFVPLDTVRAHRLESQKTIQSSGDTEAAFDLRGKVVRGNIFSDKVFSSRMTDPDVRYDIRSARGGRGGIVTAVAAIWASSTEGNKQPTPSTRTFSPPHAIKQALPPPRLHHKASPPRARPVGRTVPPPALDPPLPTANLSTKRAKLIKSTSVPAVLSASLATPMLSSTASLARPMPLADRTKPKLPPVLPSSRSGLEAKATPSPKPLSASNDLAFGQARLRELIKKYQG